MFDAASQAEIDLSVENDHDLFVKGFVLGAQMMLEFLTDGRPDGGCGQVSRDRVVGLYKGRLCLLPMPPTAVGGCGMKLSE